MEKDVCSYNGNISFSPSNGIWKIVLFAIGITEQLHFLHWKAIGESGHLVQSGHLKAAIKFTLFPFESHAFTEENSYK